MADSGSAGWRFESSRGHKFNLMNYIELVVSVTPKEQGCDILIAHLSELEFESFVENDTGFSAYIQENNFNDEDVKKTFSLYSFELKIDYKKNIIPQQNWNKEWESNFNPIDIEGKCFIRAPFHQAKPNYFFDIIIEPKMSFGTGHHDTTQLMIQKLMQLKIENKSLLDMGCGTGVLAILASKMKAQPILAVDIDDWSIENTVENLEKNNIHNVIVQKGNVQILEGKTFNTILANINKNVLIADMSIYVKNLEINGNLVLSGFFETDIIDLKAKAIELGLKFEEKIASNQWAMLHFIKTN